MVFYYVMLITTQNICQTQKSKSHVTFLETYLHSDIIPTFLNFRMPNNRCFELTVVDNFSEKTFKSGGQ